MARYIDAEELTEEIESLSVMLGGENVFKTAKKSVLRIIDEQPTADVEEVKHGEWITDENGVVICSECGEEHGWQDFRPPYCDMCGSKNRDERRDT